MAAATGHIVFLLFLTSFTLRTTHARLPNLFHKTAHFNVATEDARDHSIPKQEEGNRHQAIASASQNSKVRDVGGGLYGYSDPEKNSRETSTNYNADAYELYDEELLKGSPIGAKYNTEGEEEEEEKVYHDEAITEKKPLPYTTTSNYYYYYGTSGSNEKQQFPSYQAKETYDSTDNQYSYGVSGTRSRENGRYDYDDINDDVTRESRGGGYADPSISTHSHYNYDGNDNAFGYTNSKSMERENENAFGYTNSNSMERYEQQEQEQEQGEPRDGFTP